MSQQQKKLDQALKAESSHTRHSRAVSDMLTVGSGDCLPVFRSPEKGGGRHYTVKMRTTKSPFSQVSTNVPQTVQYVKKKIIFVANWSEQEENGVF